MRVMYFRNLLLLFCCASLFSAGLAACFDSSVPRSVKTAIVATQKKFAPDKRVALFEVRSHRRQDSLIISGESNLPEAVNDLLQELDRQQITYINRIRVLPDPALNGRVNGVVNVSVANIRTVPKHSGELATQSTLGTGLKVYKNEGDWYLVQTPDDYLGWLDKGALVLMNPKGYQGWLDQNKVIFLKDYGFVLDATTDQAGRLGDLVAGNILADAGKTEGFRAVIYPDGRRGFIPAEETEDLSGWLNRQNSPPVPAIINTALDYIGRPYLWGGTSGKGMDCSGFTKIVYFMNGMVIPRDASQQVHAGIDVSADSTFSGLQTGDFIFFGQKEEGPRPERIRHVGIYLGSGQFIHSGADNPGVKIESLFPGSSNYAAHRRETFVRARRLTPGSPGVISVRDLPAFFGKTGTLKELIQ